MDTTITIGVTRDKLKEMVGELQEALEKSEGKNHVEHTFYCEPNGRGFGEEIILTFTNDDMEADVNPDIDGTKIWADIEVA